MGLNSKKLGIYLPIGYPNKTFSEILDKISKTVDIVELGIPTKKPIYDGPIIRYIHKTLIEHDHEGLKIFYNYLDLLKNVNSEKIILTYYSEISANLENFFQTCSYINAKCVLIPDLLIEHYERLDKYIDLSKRHNLETCFFISSKFPYKLIEQLTSFKPYMIYLGLQASSGINLPIQVLRNIHVAKKLINGKSALAIGFGINSVERLKTFLENGADIAIVGTEFLRRLQRDPNEAIRFIEELSNAL